MTPRITASRAAELADIDATILHWRKMGVRAKDIGTQLKCHHKWAGIRRKMVTIAMPPRKMPSDVAIIALIGSRKLRRLTQDQVADRIGVSRRRLSHYENGRRLPSVETLTAWRAALGLRAPVRMAA